MILSLSMAASVFSLCVFFGCCIILGIGGVDMLSIILGFLVFCLAVGLFFELVESGFLLIMAFAASLLIGVGLVALEAGWFTSILGIVFIVLPFWIGSDCAPNN